MRESICTRACRIRHSSGRSTGRRRRARCGRYISMAQKQAASVTMIMEGRAAVPAPSEGIGENEGQQFRCLKGIFGEFLQFRHGGRPFSGKRCEAKRYHETMPNANPLSAPGLRDGGKIVRTVRGSMTGGRAAVQGLAASDTAAAAAAQAEAQGDKAFHAPDDKTAVAAPPEGIGEQEDEGQGFHCPKAVPGQIVPFRCHSDPPREKRGKQVAK